jgi:hypothetical protein
MTREELNEFYEAVVCQDATVQRMINEKCEPEKIIVALYNEKKALTRAHRGTRGDSSAQSRLTRWHDNDLAMSA